ncbi:HD domain-containing protein [Myceligenerans cantabricum]
MLDGRWREPHRTYHTAFHLASALDALDLLLADAGAAGEPVPEWAAWQARVALWFHDAVHDGATPADEEASAALVHDLLGPLATPEDPASGAGRPGPEPLLRQREVDEVARLVLVTADHAPDPDDLPGCLVSDADLAILGAAPAAYTRYTHQVRAEYADVPENLFREGRAQVLQALLGHGDLFRTPWGRGRWQAPAASNLATELRTLRPER